MISECEECGRRAPVCSRYLRYDAQTDTWREHQFCCGKCACAWIRTRESLPNTGLSITCGGVEHD